jgi:hypothetical protein
MELKITRWNQPAPPTEGELLQIYRQEGLAPYAWSNGATSSALHPCISAYVVRLVLAYRTPRDRNLPGDRIDLPRRLHGARVGPGGVTCLEAHLD